MVDFRTGAGKIQDKQISLGHHIVPESKEMLSNNEKTRHTKMEYVKGTQEPSKSWQRPRLEH